MTPAADAVLIWGGTFLLVALVVLGYAWHFARRTRADRERKREAERLGIDRPAAQYPFVDPEHCIGCGACVAACPEGDVLGVVGGTATVINGLRCVGHARCEVACPVGAITVGLGDMASRADLPQLGERYESSVPGVFVVGELGGLSLVRNAIAQGSEAGHEIVERSRRAAASAGDDRLDVVIVGAGPAGLATAAVCARAGLRHRVLEREASLGGSLLHYPRRKMVLTQPVELPGWGALDREEYSKEKLLETLETLVREVRPELRLGAPVTAIERDGDGFLVESRPPAGQGDTARPRHWRTRHVVLALGRRGTPRTLGVPGEDQAKVMYRLLDAASYEGEHILVVGGGDSAVEAAIGLGRQPGNRVTLSYRREKIVRVKKKNQDALDRAIAAGRVTPLYASNVDEILQSSVRLRVAEGEDASTETVEIPNDYVFIFAGGVPPFGLLRGLGLRFGGPDAQASA